MPSSVVHLPNGQTLMVTPSFGGLSFRSNNLNPHHNVFPPGWTIILNCEDDEDDHKPSGNGSGHDPGNSSTVPGQPKKHHIHRFLKPSLRSDHLFISSISYPSSEEFKPSTSPTRSIAMMLWATLWWYFHQPAPVPQLGHGAAAQTPEAGKPRGEWRVNINREGIFTGKHLLPKLERMGLIASEDSSVGLDPDDGVSKSGEGWSKMFVSQRSFWQLDPRLYLFTLTPAHALSQYPTSSPAGSRASSPDRRPIALRSGTDEASLSQLSLSGTGGSATPPHLTRSNTPPGPYTSNSHLPTYYPAPPAQYIYTNGIRHPVRPKPPRQGEIFYTRYIPSLNEYLSFRVASLSDRPCKHLGPCVATQDSSSGPTSHPSPAADHRPSDELNDVDLLHRWMNDDRVAASWGEQGSHQHQREFLEHNLKARHSFPAIGCFNGKPFGYFEIYWVREDKLGAMLGGGRDAPADYDRGIHVLVGEQSFRGSHRVRVWLSALVHYCWLADPRTETVMLEPRVDNEKLLSYCQELGFYKEREIAFEHKQSNLLKIRRDAWNAPAV